MPPDKLTKASGFATKNGKCENYLIIPCKSSYLLAKDKLRLKPPRRHTGNQGGSVVNVKFGAKAQKGVQDSF